MKKPIKKKLKSKAAKITKKTKLIAIMNKNPEAAEILFNEGMMCVGCSMAYNETFEQGCLAHGMTQKQINDLIKKINKEKKE